MPMRMTFLLAFGLLIICQETSLQFPDMWHRDKRVFTPSTLMLLTIASDYEG